MVDKEYNFLNSKFKKELTKFINNYSIENDSDTPDWIIGDFLQNCLMGLTSLINCRDIWYSFKPWENYELSDIVKSCDTCKKKSDCKIYKKAKDDNKIVNNCGFWERNELNDD